MSTHANTLRTVRMTFTMEILPWESLRSRINHLLVNSEHEFTKVVFAQISQESIGMTVFSKKQLRFRQWKETLEKLCEIKLNDEVITAKSIETAHNIITSSPTVQTIYAQGYVPQAVGMSFAAVVSSTQDQNQGQDQEIDVPSFVQVKVARTDSVASPGAAAVVETNPVESVPVEDPVPTPTEVPVPAPAPAPAEPPKSTAFDVDMNRALSKARKLMETESCVSKFKDFSNIPVDEYLPNYVARKKELMNLRDSHIEHCIKTFIPEVMRARTANFNVIISEITDEDHKKTLASLRRWYNMEMHSFYPWHYSEEFVYNFNKLISGKCSLFEVHRRIMALEGLVAKLTKYTYEVMNKKPNKGGLPRPVVQKAGLVIASGSGLLGAGENFWALNDKMKTARGSGDFASAMETQAEFGNSLKYLMENRAIAMTRTGLVAAGELTWGIPLLALFVEVGDLTSKLKERDSASELWGRIQRFEENRKKVHVADLMPMVKYGETLTAYCKSLQEICKALKSTGTSLKVEFPKGVDMVTINRDGQIVGPSGSGLQFGHLEAVTNPVIIPFPSVAVDIIVETPEAIKEKFNAYLNGETVSIQSMLGVLGIEDAIALRMMRLERENIKRILNTDSHTANRTHVLPPTASLPMPLANYMPLKIYEMH